MDRVILLPTHSPTHSTQPITPLIYFCSHSCHSFTLSSLVRINLHRFHHPPNYIPVLVADPPRICLFSLERGGIHQPRRFFCFQAQCVLGSSDRCIVSDVVTRSRPLLCLQKNAPRVHFDVRFPCMSPISAADFLFLNSRCFQRRPHWMNSIRPLCQQSFHHSALHSRLHLPQPPLPSPLATQTSSPPPSHCTCLSVPSQFRPSWRPPCNMPEISTSKGTPWSEQQPAFAEKLEPESPHTPLFHLNIPTVHRIDNRLLEVMQMVYLLGGGTSWPLTPPLFPPWPAKLHPGNTEDNTQATALRDARRSKERTYPELVHPGRCRLVVLGVEAGGRWSEEAAGFIRQLAKARARQSPDPLRQAVTAALIARWSALLAHATFTALAASLLCEDTSSHNNVNGFLPPGSEILAHMPREPAAPAEPQPPLKEHGLDLATPPSSPGDWPVQQSKTETLQKKTARKTKNQWPAEEILSNERSVAWVEWSEVMINSWYVKCWKWRLATPGVFTANRDSGMNFISHFRCRDTIILTYRFQQLRSPNMCECVQS